MSSNKHNKLQAEAYQWAHNTFPQIRGHLFAVLNEIPYTEDPRKTTAENRKAHTIRIMQAKAIGLRAGVLDMLLIVPGATYGFDPKIKPDKLSDEQQKFIIEVLRPCGGDGWGFYDILDFKRIFTGVMQKHYGDNLVTCKF